MSLGSISIPGTNRTFAQMECLLHYCWKHQLLPLRHLTSTRGEPVEVINPGRHNHDAGPDFLYAQVRIGGQLWAGNVEIHVRSSDWYRHHHDRDRAYANVILHVVQTSDRPVTLPYMPDIPIPEVVVPIPEHVRQQYAALVASESHPRCADVLRGLQPLTVRSWLTRLATERLEQRTEQIDAWRRERGMDWEATLFAALARHFGFGVNGEAFEEWAKTITPAALSKHRDDLFQMEAIFFGQAGLLEPPASGPDAPYRERLQGEYHYLQKLFGLKGMDASRWKFLRLRPQNFPHIRLAQLAMLHHERRLSLSAVVTCKTVKQLRALLDTHVSPFWQTHYTFRSKPSAPSEKHLSTASKDLLIINALAPVAFAYGQYRGDSDLCERALGWLETMRPEDNLVVRQWRLAGVNPESAADTQALMQLHRQYCERHDCLRCRFGSEYIRRTPTFLCEVPSYPAPVHGEGAC